MNFIAGFLFLFLKEEALAFAVMRKIIQRFGMSNLFNTELPMLKLNFYQLDRLISILLPDLHAHFKVRRSSLPVVNVFVLLVGGSSERLSFQLRVLHCPVYIRDELAGDSRTHVEAAQGMGLLYHCMYSLSHVLS